MVQYIHIHIYYNTYSSPEKNGGLGKSAVQCSLYYILYRILRHVLLLLA